MEKAAVNHTSLDLPDRAVRVGRIRYINVAPVYFGLDNGLRPSWIQLVSEPPAVLNKMLSEGQLDISPVSSVAYALNHKKWLLLPDNSISCFGKVMSVLLASKYPFEQLDGKNVLLTDESASAASLLKLLFSLKQIQPFFTKAPVKKPADIFQAVDAALVIGDSALSGSWMAHFPNIMDLGSMWKDLTGLPFVFAVWAVRKKFADDFPGVVETVARLFHCSRQNGEKNLELIASRSAGQLGFSPCFCSRYYSCLGYNLNRSEKTGLEVFLYAMFRKKMLPEKVKLSFIKGLGKK